MNDVNDVLPMMWGYALFAVRVALVVWALVGAVLAVRAPSGAYVVHGRGTKPVWVGVCLATAAVIGLGFLPMFVEIIGVVAVGVFFADVRPAVGDAR